MLKHRLVEALLLGVPAMASLLASVAIVQAAEEECRIKPGSTAPAGSRWLYQINRADHRHCWFLSSTAVGVRSQPGRGRRDLASDTVRQDQQQDSDLQTASAPTEKTNVAVVAGPPALPQVAGPSVDPSLECWCRAASRLLLTGGRHLVRRITAGPTVSAERSAERPSPGASKSNVVLVAGAAAAALCFAGGVFHFTRRGHLRSRKRAVADRNGVSGVRSSVAAKSSPMMADPAEGLKRNLRELGHHLKPALEACNLPLSNQTGPVSLPDTAAWLTRPKAKPPAEQTIRQLADA